MGQCFGKRNPKPTTGCTARGSDSVSGRDSRSSSERAESIQAPSPSNSSERSKINQGCTRNGALNCITCAPKFASKAASKTKARCIEMHQENRNLLRPTCPVWEMTLSSCGSLPESETEFTTFRRSMPESPVGRDSRTGNGGVRMGCFSRSRLLPQNSANATATAGVLMPDCRPQNLASTPRRAENLVPEELLVDNPPRGEPTMIDACVEGNTPRTGSHSPPQQPKARRSGSSTTGSVFSPRQSQGSDRTNSAEQRRLQRPSAGSSGRSANSGSRARSSSKAMSTSLDGSSAFSVGDSQL